MAVLAAKRIAQMREAKGWTQTDLSRRLGVSQKWISDVECAKTTPRLDTLDRLARALSVELFELLLPEGPKPLDPITLDSRKIASVLKRCDERSRQCLWAVMETVADYRAKR